MTTYTAQELGSKKNDELVAIWNGMCSSDAYVSSWKKSKDILVGRIIAAQGRQANSSSVAVSKPKIVVDTSAPTPPPAKKPKSTAAKKPKADKKPREDRADTIRSVALDLLCEVAYYEDRNEDSGPDNRVMPGDAEARSVGITYEEMLRRIKAHFPGAETTAECLRWYASHVRNGETGYEGRKLPQRRPRSPSATTKPAAKDPGF